MVQEPLVKTGSVIKIDGNDLTVATFHKGYVIAHDRKERAKVVPFRKIESLF